MYSQISKSLNANLKKIILSALLHDGTKVLSKCQVVSYHSLGSLLTSQYQVRYLRSIIHT